MNFNEHLNRIKKLLQNEYPEINFDNDFSVSNKLNDLAWIITKRINDPNPTPEEKPDRLPDKNEGWRMKL